MKKTDPKIALGSNIIYLWYQEFENISQAFGEYCSILSKQKHTGDDETVDIENASNIIRSLIIRNYLKSFNLFKVLNVKVPEEIKQIFNDIKLTEYIIKTDTIEKYITSIQEILLNESITEIINTSSSILEDAYGKGRNDTNNQSSDNDNW